MRPPTAIDFERLDKGSSMHGIGVHQAAGLSDSDLLRRIRQSVNMSKLLPLPGLLMPCSTAKKSARVRQRGRNKRCKCRTAYHIAAALGWLYCGREGVRPGKPCALSDMGACHREAWAMLLHEAGKLNGARRQLATDVTGAQCLHALLKCEGNSYTRVRNNYVPMQAELIAEPSRQVGIPLSEALPSEMASWYSAEENLLKNGGTDTQLNMCYTIVSVTDWMGSTVNM